MALDDYITIEQLGDYMNVDELFQTSADLAMAAAQQAVRKYLDQDVTLVEDDVEVHSGKGRKHLRLRQRPVREITSIIVDDTELAAEDWVLRGARVTLPDDFFTWGHANIEVTYSHGWDVPDELSSAVDYDPVPADIVLVTLSVARREYMKMGSASAQTFGQVQSETMGSYSYTLKDVASGSVEIDLFPTERAILERYVVRWR